VGRVSKLSDSWFDRCMIYNNAELGSLVEFGSCVFCNEEFIITGVLVLYK
jgi:hypothetical protein